VEFVERGKERFPAMHAFAFEEDLGGSEDEAAAGEEAFLVGPGV
jgi:hypothetical protein